ncbi:hypothetical protein ON010_g2316 [Phytophthora cinnamomi]|nr:hypothetical protein ON010_g2316 [Phytophthora cinnamomi]
MELSRVLGDWEPSEWEVHDVEGDLGEQSPTEAARHYITSLRQESGFHLQKADVTQKAYNKHSELGLFGLFVTDKLKTAWRKWTNDVLVTKERWRLRGRFQAIRGSLKVHPPYDSADDISNTADVSNTEAAVMAATPASAARSLTMEAGSGDITARSRHRQSDDLGTTPNAIQNPESDTRSVFDAFGNYGRDPLRHSRLLLEHFQRKFASIAVPIGVSILDEIGVCTKARTMAKSFMPLKPDKFAIRFYAIVGWRSLYVHSLWDNGTGNTMPTTALQRYTQIFPSLREPSRSTLERNDVQIEPESATALWLAMIAHQAKSHRTDRRLVVSDNFYTRHKLAKARLSMTDGSVRMLGTSRRDWVGHLNMGAVTDSIERVGQMPRGSWELVAAVDSFDDSKKAKEAHLRAQNNYRNIFVPPAYDIAMNGADRVDQLRSTNPTRRKEMRVSMSLLTWVLDLGVINAFALMKHIESKENHLRRYENSNGGPRAEPLPSLKLKRQVGGGGEGLMAKKKQQKQLHGRRHRAELPLHVECAGASYSAECMSRQVATVCVFHQSYVRDTNRIQFQPIAALYRLALALQAQKKQDAGGRGPEQPVRRLYQRHGLGAGHASLAALGASSASQLGARKPEDAAIWTKELQFLAPIGQKDAKTYTLTLFVAAHADPRLKPPAETQNKAPKATRWQEGLEHFTPTMLAVADASRDFHWGIGGEQSKENEEPEDVEQDTADRRSSYYTSVFEDDGEPAFSRRTAFKNVQKWFGVDEFLLLGRSSPHERKKQERSDRSREDAEDAEDAEEKLGEGGSIEQEVSVEQEVEGGKENAGENGGEDAMADIHVDQNEAGMLLSALTMALNNCNCTIPAFVPVFEPSRGTWIGSAVPGATGNVSMSFDTDSVPELNPNQSCISGLLDFFKVKLQLPPHIEEKCRVEADESGGLAIGMSGVGFVRLPSKDQHQIRQITTKLFGDSHPSPLIGASTSPLSGMDLTVSWPQLREGTYVDNVVHSTLDPNSAPEWMLTARFQDLLSENQRKPQLPLCKQIANLVQVYSNSRELNKDILVSELAPPMPVVPSPAKPSSNHGVTNSGGSDDAPESQPSQSISESAIPAARAVGVLGSAISSLVSAATWKGSDAEEIRRVISELFDGAEGDGSGENGELDGRSGLPLVSVPSSVEHGAPLGELVAILATRMSQLHGINSMSLLWVEFVKALRERWFQQQLLPYMGTSTKENGVDHNTSSHSLDALFLLDSEAMQLPPPDFRHCLLHQKLQLLNSCILREAQESRPASNSGDRIKANYNAQQPAVMKGDGQTTKSSDVDGVEGDADGSPSDDEFFDSVEQQDTPVSSPPRAPRRSEGVLREAVGVVCLQTNEPLLEPVTQTAVPMTEDVAKQQQDLLTRLGVSVESDKLRQQIQSTALVSDMQSFKAANPRSCLADFIRWYSPKDWISFKKPVDPLQTELPPVGRGIWWFEQHGMLSERMRFGPGHEHLWQQMWETSAPVPANRQKRLFDPSVRSGDGIACTRVSPDATGCPSRFAESSFTRNRSIALLDEALAESQVAFSAAGRSKHRGDRLEQSVAAAHQGQQLQVAFEMALDACWKLVRSLEATEALITKTLALLHYFSVSKDDQEALALVNLLLAPSLSQRQQLEISALLKKESLRQQVAAILLTNPTLAEAGPMTVPVQREYVLRCICPRPFLREYYGDSALDGDGELSLMQPDEELEDSPLVYYAGLAINEPSMTTAHLSRLPSMHRLAEAVSRRSVGPKDKVVVKRPDGSFSTVTLRFCWFGFIALHAFCFVYFAVFGWCYWNLPGTLLNTWLFFYSLGMDSKYDRVIGVVHGCMAVVHLVYLLWMVSWAFKKRRLVFAVYNLFTRPLTKESKIESRWASIMSSAYDGALSKRGLLEVDGPYFDLVLLCREVIETALQTQQAYRMSLLLPRSQLNRGYTALLVLNCWSTALVHSFFHTDAARRRLLAVVCDSVLDMVTSVGITSVLLAIYYRDFDFQLSGFPMNKWYDDIWVVHVLSEFQLLLVSSWGDLTLRGIFALSMINNMNNMKKILTAKLPKRKKSNSARQVTSVVPLHSSMNNSSDTRTHSKLDIIVASESRFTQVLFVIWGAVILVLHLYAESVPGLPQYCYESNVVGKENEVAAQWSAFNPKTTVRIVLKFLKMYNSTVVRWSESAALSQNYHPNLMKLYLVRVNMTNGELPAGLLSDDFPHILLDIEFCVTNLRTLPDDFELKWPQSASIYFEKNDFTEVPASLARLAPYDLSLAMNPISTIPSSVLEGNVGFLHIGGTLVTELPETVADVSPSLVLRVDNTNITFFWDWIDPVLESHPITPEGMKPILATNSPYCTDLQ